MRQVCYRYVQPLKSRYKGRQWYLRHRLAGPTNRNLLEVAIEVNDSCRGESPLIYDGARNMRLIIVLFYFGLSSGFPMFSFLFISQTNSGRAEVCSPFVLDQNEL